MQYRAGLYFVYWIKYHQSTPEQTIPTSEIKQSVKTISNEIKNNLQWDKRQSPMRLKTISNTGIKKKLQWDENNLLWDKQITETISIKPYTNLL